MNQAELETYRQKLLELGRRLKGDVSGLESEALRTTGGEASGNLSNTPLHLADLGTDTYEEEIAAALDRIERGTFGRCEECGKEIPRERLNALPYTRHCVACARKVQGEAGPRG